MINKGYRLGTGGLDKAFPARWKEGSASEVRPFSSLMTWDA